MLTTGFELDIRKLETLGLPPRIGRHTSMFSTTFPEQVQKLGEHCMRDIDIFLAVETLDGANEGISQIIEIIPEAKKTIRLMQWLKAIQSETIVVASSAPLDLFLFAFLESEQFLQWNMFHSRGHVGCSSGSQYPVDWVCGQL